MKIQVLLSTTNLPMSWLIRTSTWSEWSHCALVDGDHVIEAAMLKGVVRTPIDEYKARASRWMMLEFDVPDAELIIAAAESQINKPYDYVGALGLGLHQDWRDMHAWWCSDLLVWAFEQGRAPLFRAEALKRTVPQHLWMLPAPA